MRMTTGRRLALTLLCLCLGSAGAAVHLLALQDQIEDESISKNSVEELKVAKKDELTAKAGIQESTFTDSQGTYTHPEISSELQEKVEVASSTSSDVKKKMIAKKPEKKTWVSDWVFDYPK